MSEIAVRMGRSRAASAFPFGGRRYWLRQCAQRATDVETFERVGLAGLMLEDQVFPKRCGHLAGKAVIGRDEMVAKDSRRT